MQALPFINHMNEYYKIIGLTILCFLAGIMLWSEFFMLSVNEIKDTKLIVNMNGIRTLTAGRYLFAVTVGLIPLLHFGVSKFSNIKSASQKLISFFIILVCGLAVWQTRIMTEIIKAQKDISITEAIDPQFYSEYPLNKLKPHIYLTLGVAMGVIVSAGIFKIINDNEKKKGNIG